jgi:hypothetical protein
MKFRYDSSFQSSGTRRLLGALDVAYRRTLNIIYGDSFFGKELRSKRLLATRASVGTLRVLQ